MRQGKYDRELADLGREFKGHTHARKEKAMYYTVIDENCNTCGHKHRLPGRAVDCFDKMVENGLFCKHGKLTIPGHHTCPKGCTAPKTAFLYDEPVIVEVKKPIPLEEAGFLRAAYQKYGEDQPFQEFADKWL
jgi:hypothetical protein